MSVVMSKAVTVQLLHDLAEANDRAIKRFGEPAFEIDWESLEVTYKGKRRSSMFDGSDNMPGDPEQQDRE